MFSIINILKNYKIIFFISILEIPLFADPPQPGELLIHLVNPVDPPLINVEAHGIVWGSLDVDYSITNSFDNMSDTNYWFFLEHIDGGSFTEDDTIGYGLYEININGDFIYLDWRDCDYNTCYTDPDYYLYYNVSTGQFYKDVDLIILISSGDTAVVWDSDHKNYTYSNTNCFQPTTPENFTYINVDNNPKISWDASDPYNGGVTYTLYRKDPGETEFSVIASNLTNTHYLDTEVEICCGNTSVTYQYKVVATSGDGSKDSDETDPINVKAKTGEVINTNKKELVEILPESFSLDRPFPNPFNPVTTIKYDLPEQSIVQLVVFDLLGRKSNTLKSVIEDAGWYSIRWDGKEENGNLLSWGMYIIKISAQSLESEESFTKAQKVVLLK